MANVATMWIYLSKVGRISASASAFPILADALALIRPKALTLYLVPCT